ncbi:MAG: chemotaxis protein CheW [Nitrospirae bacterium]|nr:chemotaxis protein CheW [Nitrospirota bacterium]MCL5422877.1 chemotaxis protein CheW [Nitrospirota bacterium]
MDIAKIRKKFKETVQQGPEKPGTTPDVELRKGEDFPGAPAVQVSRKVETALEGEGAGITPAPEETAESVVELLTFTLAREEYAFRVEDLQEIIRPQRITRIPKSEAHLLGITSLRGKIIPVIDLKKMLSLDGKAGEEVTKQKIAIVKGPKGPIGALIDRIVGVIRPSVSQIVESPAHLPETEMKYIEGVAIVEGKFISILRIEEAIAL